MRQAIRAGEFSVVGFLRGFNDGLKVFQDEKNIQAYAEQFEDELPIDLIESCKFEYKDDVSEHVTKTGDVETLMANGAKDVTITLVAHVKNKYGDFSKSNDYVHKLENCMAKDFKPHEENKKDKIFSEFAGTVTLRIGKDIYENCFLKELAAEVTSDKSSVYDMKITAKLLYNIFEGMYSEDSREYDGITILNPNHDVNGIRGNFDFDTENV
jgi:hypothetical protein